MNLISSHLHYICALLLFLFGLYALIVMNNLIRKIFGLVILQTAVILFYISLAAKGNAGIPIVSAHGHGAINPDLFANPLPHALMLTAIVVAASTLGVALVLVISVYQDHQSLEEDQILERLRAE